MSAINEIRSKETLNSMGHFANGIVATSLMMTILNPLDVAKTWRMNSWGRPPMHALYRGFGTGCASVVPATAVAFLSNAVANREFKKSRKLSQDQQKIAAVFVSGFASAPIITAFDSVKTRQQVYDGSGLFVLRSIIKHEGVAAMFKALPPTLCRELFFNAAMFWGRERVARILKGGVHHDKVRQASADIVTGVISGYLSTPFDLMRVRMQKAKGEEKILYQTMARTFQAVVEKEGVEALWKGGRERAVFVGGALFIMGRAMDYIPQYFPASLHRNTSN